jgi:hypothetical protein
VARGLRELGHGAPDQLVALLAEVASEQKE